MPVLEAENVADLIRHLGVPAHRIRLHPPLGHATEEDAIVARPYCELIDGVLVEKALGFYESRVAVILGHYLEDYLETNDIGFTLGEGGMMRIRFGQVRIPDVSFYYWSRFPNREMGVEQILNCVPDLAVEVLSPSNTPEEMLRKRREYFEGGAKLVWIVDPEQKTVEVFTAVDQSTVLTEDQVLEGGDVLPGFKLSIAKWFARVGKRK